MSDLYTITEYTAEVDQVQHPELNYPEYTKLVDQELGKFIRMVAGLNSDFIAPQDVSGVGGLSCRFHSINGYPAVRQMTQYNPNSKSWFVWFDCRVLSRAPEAIKPDGDVSAKLEPIEAPATAPAAESTLTEAEVLSEVTNKFLVH